MTGVNHQLRLSERWWKINLVIYFELTLSRTLCKFTSWGFPFFGQNNKPAYIWQCELEVIFVTYLESVCICMSLHSVRSMIRIGQIQITSTGYCYKRSAYQLRPWSWTSDSIMLSLSQTYPTTWHLLQLLMREREKNNRFLFPKSYNMAFTSVVNEREKKVIAFCSPKSYNTAFT